MDVDAFFVLDTKTNLFLTEMSIAAVNSLPGSGCKSHFFDVAEFVNPKVAAPGRKLSL